MTRLSKSDPNLQESIEREDTIATKEGKVIVQKQRCILLGQVVM